MVAVNDPQSEGLRRPPSAFSYSSDSIHPTSRFAARCEGGIDNLCHSGSGFVLLASGALSHPLLAGLANRPARLLCAISLSAQHDEGATVNNHLPDRRNLSAIRQEILAPRLVGTHIHADLRHVRIADCGHSYLGHCDRLDGAPS